MTTAILAIILTLSATIQSNIITLNPSEYETSQVSTMITDPEKDLINFSTSNQPKNILAM